MKFQKRMTKNRKKEKEEEKSTIKWNSEVKKEKVCFFARLLSTSSVSPSLLKLSKYKKCSLQVSPEGINNLIIFFSYRYVRHSCVMFSNIYPIEPKLSNPRQFDSGSSHGRGCIKASIYRIFQRSGVTHTISVSHVRVEPSKRLQTTKWISLHHHREENWALQIKSILWTKLNNRLLLQTPRNCYRYLPCVLA